MSLLSFKIRNPNRDKETDEARLRMIASTLDDILKQIERESSGLQARYNRVAADAAFSLQAMENDRGEKMGSKVDELTRSLARSRFRLKELEEQLTFFRRLQQQVYDYTGKV